MYKPLSVVLLIVLMLGALPTLAIQDTGVTCDAAEWYETVDPDQKIPVLYVSVLDTDAKVSVKAQNLAKFTALIGDIAELETPECLEDIKDRYMKGLELLTQSLNSLMDNDAITFALQFGQGMQRIGEFRGYMQALGANVEYTENKEMYFK